MTREIEKLQTNNIKYSSITSATLLGDFAPLLLCHLSLREALHFNEWDLVQLFLPT